MIRYLVLAFFFISTVAFSQKGQVKSGQFYEAGTKVFGYKAGVSSVVPENWEGLVPRDQEVFLLSSTNSFAEVYVFVNENDNLESIKKDGMPAWILEVTLHLNRMEIMF
ncbi:MAG: hypothetical protein HC811_08610 [Flammeovirgaceae bacterium]|nr:hypothetical protein [Flammeovirgaceae bacterium]